jgi:hypothetical protein
MEKYLKSTAVKVFPSAFRGPSSGSTKYNPEARLNTEFNVTNLTNRLASKDNFVIDWSSETKIIKFNIHGYYFEANLTEFLGVGGEGASWTNLYASIKIIPFITDEGEAPALNTKYKALTLVGATDSGDSIANPSGRILDVADGGTFIFEGLELSQTPRTPGSNIYELYLLSGGPSAWAVPLTSRLKFVATDVEGLPKINNDLTLDTSDTVFAPITVGTANQVLISSGVTNGVTNAPVWSGATIGSTTQPIYLNGGVITAITGAIANNTTGSAATLTTPRLFTVTDNDATNSQAAATSFNGSAAYTVRLPATIKANLTGNVSGNVTGNLTGNVTGDVSGNAGTVTNGVYTTSSSGQSITVSNGNGLEVRGSSSGNAYGIYGRAGAFARSIAVLANGQGSNTDSWGLAITRGASNNTDDGLNSDHLRFRGTRNNIKFLSDGVTPNPSAASYIAIEPASLAASRTYTLPDAGTNADFVMTQGNQTIAGTKTFSDTISGSLSGNATTATAASTVTVNTTETAGNFKIPFANTAVSTTGNYQLLQDNTATFTYNPSTNVLVAGTFSGVGAYVKESTVDIYVQRIFTASVLNPGGAWTTRYNAGTGNGLQVIANNVGADYVSGFYSPSDNDRFIFDVRVGTSNSVIKAVVYSQFGSSTSNENNSAIISFSTMNTSGHIVQYSFRWKVIIDNGVRFINLGGGTKITFK